MILRLDFTWWAFGMELRPSMGGSTWYDFSIRGLESGYVGVTRIFDERAGKLCFCYVIMLLTIDARSDHCKVDGYIA